MKLLFSRSENRKSGGGELLEKSSEEEKHEHFLELVILHSTADTESYSLHIIKDSHLAMSSTS